MALYLLVPAVLWLGTSVPPARDDRLAKIGKAAALAWLPLAPLFYVVPENINGAYERLLALVMLGAVAAAAWPLYQKPREGAQ
jgi:peptidoglycan/LPS O-acetylase OafA/YrhL